MISNLCNLLYAKRNLILLAVLLLILIMVPVKVHGLGVNAPDPVDNPLAPSGNVKLLVSRSGVGNGLEAEVSQVVVYFASANGTLIINNGRDQCGLPKPDTNTSAATLFSFYTYNGATRGTQITTARTSAEMNCGDYPVNFTNITAVPVGTSTFYPVFVQADHNGPRGGINAFSLRISAGGGIISYFSGSGKKFAIQDRLSDTDDDSTFILKFGTDCRETTAVRAELGWFDDDAGNPALVTANFGAELWEIHPVTRAAVLRIPKTSFAYTGNSNPGDVGGAREYMFKPGYKYEWRWYGVKKTNGIQFQLPFNSIFYAVDCRPPGLIITDDDPIVTVNANCSTISGTAADPDRPAARRRITISINGSVIYSGPNRPDGSFSIATPPAYQNTTGSYVVDVTSDGVMSNGATGVDGSATSTAFGPCYAATCSNPTISLPFIRAGADSFNTTATFSNTGQLTWNGRMTTRVNGDSYNGIPSSPIVNGTVPGSSILSTFGTYTSPAGTLAPQTINMELVFDGGAVIANCPVAFNPYTEFILTLDPGNIYLVPDPEDPTNATYASSVNVRYVQVVGPPFSSGSITATRSVTKNGGPIPGGSSATNGNFPDSGITLSPSVTEPRLLGDAYCGTIRLNNTTGWVDGSGTSVINVAGPAATPAPVCDTIIDKPYVRVYGGDVFAGGAFAVNGSCGSQAPGALKASSNPLKGGSATQLAAEALGVVSGFGSASMRTGAPMRPSGLTFANNNPILGLGNFATSSTSHCVNDYFTDTQFNAADTRKTTTASTTIMVNNGQMRSGEQTLYSGGGLMRVQGPGNSSQNVRHTLYVDGDVVIEDSLEGNNDLGSDITVTPYIAIIVRGNIYIEPDVTELSGLYIAQPKLDGSGGGIYTCRPATGIATGAMVGACSNTLVVNGSLIAKNLYLQRTRGSLRDGTPNQPPTPTTTIAEVFNGSPEFFIGRPVFRTQTGLYDSIKALPPVL